MKKIISVLVTVTLFGTFVLGGCGKGDSVEKSSDTTVSTKDNVSGESKDQATSKKIRVGYVDSGSSFPDDALAIAFDQGYLDEELAAVGYELEAIPFTGAGPALNEALVNGSIDAASTGDVPAINGKSKGIDTTLLVGEIYYNDAGIYVQNDSDIQTVADLRGKTVATLQGSYMHKSLINILDDAGLSFSDINFTSMPSPDAASAVEAGAVDAAIVASAQEAILNNSENVRMLKNCDNHPEWKGGHAFIIKSDYLADNRDAAVAIVKAYRKADIFALSNYDAALKSLSKSSNGNAEAFKISFPEAINFNVKSGDEVVKAYESIKQFLIDNELLGDDFSVADWIDTSIWDDATIE